MPFTGPSAEEQRNGITTELPGLPSAALPAPTTTPGSTEAPAETSAGTPNVSVKPDSISIELPYRVALPRLGTQQLICTAAAAHRMADPSAGPVTVTVTDGGGWRAKGSDERCPAP